MSRQTYTYKINPDKIRDNLVPRLKDETNNVKSFSNYILNETNPRRDPLKIIETLQGNHKDFSVTAWRLAFDWICDIHGSEDEFDSLLDHLGFELIYELYTKDKCWVYVSQIYEFEEMNGVDYVYDQYDVTYSLYPSDFFKHYLNYLVILLKKISLDVQYKGHRTDYSEDEFSLNDNDIDDILDAQTDRALIWIREDNEEADIKESHYGRSASRMHYYVAPEMFSQIKELHETLRHYDGNIFIYDSQ